MMNETSIQSVTLAAKRIIESECRYNFETYAIDDREHIPRMERIADAVRTFLSETGLAPERCDAVREDLIDHARRLYVAEWMRPLLGDTAPPLEEDGVREFNKHLKKQQRKKTKRGRRTI